MATVRREVRIDRPSDEVWQVVGGPDTIHEWFPGIVDSMVEEDLRTVTLGPGLRLAERILTVDAPSVADRTIAGSSRWAMTTTASAATTGSAG